MGASTSNAGNPALRSLYTQWADMKTKLNKNSLREHPEWSPSAMDLVFSIERETSIVCGSPTGDDQVLLLIAKQHGGS
jgi:hypothetical protein